jgi:hypothetical protein
MSRTRYILGLAALTALGGCQNLEEFAQPKPVVAPSHPTYCYRTLASVNCYLAPRPGDTLVGIDVPPPPAPARPAEGGKPPEAAKPEPAPTAIPAPAPRVTSEPAPPPAPAAPAPAASGPVPLSPYANGARRGD